MTTVACDVCGERYQVSRSAFGRTQKCKVCLVPFDVCSHTVAPDEDEAKADDEPETSEFAVVQRAVGTGLTTLALVGCFAWMASLPFRNPRAVADPIAAVAPIVNQVPRVTLAPPVQPAAALHASATPNAPAPASSVAQAPDAGRFDLSKLPDSATPATVDADDSMANTADSTTSGRLPSDSPADTSPAEPLVLRLGMKIQVRKNNVVRAALVSRMLGDGAVEVHYLDVSVSETPIEVVKVEEIERLGSPKRSTSEASRPGTSRNAEGGLTNYEGPGKVSSSGLKVTKYGQLKPGLIVQVVWGGSGVWFPADVMKRNPNGTVRIHYRGRSDSFDEDVPLEKIQLAHDGINLK